ncbi:MAG: UDP-N-acetylmuramate dehydrogenase [Patescibacteria group bacterium]
MLEVKLKKLISSGYLVKLDYPLSDLTTFKIGSQAQAAGYLAVSSFNQVVKILKVVTEEDIPYKIIAGGSNLVLADKLLPYLFIHWQSIEGIEVDGNRIFCSAGVSLKDLVAESLEVGLGGLETLSGIPGSVGGAVVGNAGAYGQSISDHLTAVTFFDGYQLLRLEKKECNFSYRHSLFKKNQGVVLAAEFQLTPVDKNKLQEISREIIVKREAKYPPGLLCPGSFYKNWPVADLPKEFQLPADKIIVGKLPAGWVLEEVGAKGLTVGGVKVADYHGNLIINKGQGTFADVKALDKELRQRVKKRFGLELEPEIRYIE